MTRTIIAGSRGIEDYEELKRVVHDSGIDISIVISGTARGVDQLGERYAREYDLGLWSFPANWKRLGNRAGHVRNMEMALHAQALIALWDGESPGTKDMIEIAKQRNLRVCVKNLKTQELTILLDYNPLGV